MAKGPIEDKKLCKVISAVVALNDLKCSHSSNITLHNHLRSITDGNWPDSVLNRIVVYIKPGIGGVDTKLIPARQTVGYRLGNSTFFDNDFGIFFFHPRFHVLQNGYRFLLAHLNNSITSEYLLFSFPQFPARELCALEAAGYIEEQVVGARREIAFSETAVLFERLCGNEMWRN